MNAVGIALEKSISQNKYGANKLNLKRIVNRELKKLLENNALLCKLIRYHAVKLRAVKDNNGEHTKA